MPSQCIDPFVSPPRDVIGHELVADLYHPAPSVYWADLVMTAIVGWSAFAVSIVAASQIVIVACAGVAALALYRGACFTHEIAHLRRRALRGFESTWNWLFGIPLLLPSFTYLGVHQNHHSLSTYGTKDDPEYLPFARSRLMTVLFGVQSTMLLPVLLVARFLVLAPLGLLWPRFHRWLEVYASSFAMNPSFRRDVPPATAKKMRRWEAAVLGVWSAAIGLIAWGAVAPRALILWFAVLMLLSFLNTMRVLGAHEYDSDGSPLSREGQLADSIDTPGAWWTELWAPVGLRYHALHHYFPGMPYHNLGRAYRRITEAIPADSGYRRSISPSLPHSLIRLLTPAKGGSWGLLQSEPTSYRNASSADQSLPDR